MGAVCKGAPKLDNLGLGFTNSTIMCDEIGKGNMCVFIFQCQILFILICILEILERKLGKY
jgi:hypothetical protein